MPKVRFEKEKRRKTYEKPRLPRDISESGRILRACPNSPSSFSSPSPSSFERRSFSFEPQNVPNSNPRTSKGSRKNSRNSNDARQASASSDMTKCSTTYCPRSDTRARSERNSKGSPRCFPERSRKSGSSIKSATGSFMSLSRFQESRRTPTGTKRSSEDS